GIVVDGGPWEHLRSFSEESSDAVVIGFRMNADTVLLFRVEDFQVKNFACGLAPSDSCQGISRAKGHVDSHFSDDRCRLVKIEAGFDLLIVPDIADSPVRIRVALAVDSPKCK